MPRTLTGSEEERPDPFFDAMATMVHSLSITLNDKDTDTIFEFIDILHEKHQKQLHILRTLIIEAAPKETLIKFIDECKNV